MYVLALEASTQAAKAAVVGLDGQCAAQVEKPYPPDVSDIATLDAARAHDALIEAGALAVERAKALGVKDIAAAGLCTIWQSLLPQGRLSEPLSRAQTWAHTGSGNVASAYRGDTALCREYYRRTGCVPHSQLPVFQARHMRESQPDVFANAARFGSLNSYLLGRLTGSEFSPRCTMAGSGFLNLKTLEWDDLALEVSGIRRDKLPPLCDATTPLTLTREAANALGVDEIPLAAGGGDGGLNQIGSGALRDGVMTCSIGTSAALRIASRAPVLTDPPATWCYYTDQGWYVSGAATSGACNCVDWVRANILGGAPFPALERAMEQSRANWADAPVFLPFLWGERCPGWDDARAGGYVNLRGAHGAGELYYAALESVLMLLRMCYEKITEVSGEPNRVCLSGGITNSRPWMQMAADVFGRPVEISSAKNASLMGAAALAMTAAEKLDGLEHFPSPQGDTIMPNPAMAEHYGARKARFEEAYAK